MPEEQAASAETEQAAAPVEETGAPAAESKAEQEPDYKALVAERERERDEAKAQLAKLQSNLRSVQGNRARDADIRDKLATNASYLRHLEEQLDLIQGHLQTLGIDDPALGQLKERRQQTVQAETQAADFTRWTNLRVARIVKENTVNGAPVLDLAAGPELEEMRRHWDEALAAHDRDAIRDAQDEAIEIIAKAKREKEKMTTQATKKAAPPKPAAEEELDMDSGPGAGGAGSLSLEKLAKVDTRGMGLRALREHDKALDAAMRRAR